VFAILQFYCYEVGHWSFQYRDVSMSRLKLILVATILVAFTVVAIAAVNPLARHYVLQEYPEVKSIEQLNVSWDRSVECEGVVVERPGLTATLKYVHVSADKKVTIQGGKIDLTLTKPSSTPGGAQRGLSIEAYDLDATVRRGSLTFHSSDLDVTADAVTFNAARVTHPKGEVTLRRGSYDQKERAIKVERAVTRIDPNRLKLPERWSKLLYFEPSRVVLEHISVPVLDIDEALSSQTERLMLRAESVQVESSLPEPMKQGPLWAFDDLRLSVIDNGNPDTSGYQIWARTVRTNHPLFKTRRVNRAGTVLTAADINHVKVLAADINHVKVLADPNRWRQAGISIQIGDDEAIHVQVQDGQLSATAPCAGWLRNLPGPVSGDLADYSLGNAVSGHLTATVTMSPQLKIEQDCKLRCDHALIANLKRSFKQSVYKANGADRYLRETGPGTKGWTPLGLLPPHVPDVFIALEDPGFLHHKGVHLLAINNSLKQNVEADSIVRGGSTITMQLVRNLWLTRHQTIQRKAREVLLAWMLEGCLSKREILELYLNVIEFGPETYGIAAGSKRRFDKSPSFLTLEEAFYLAHILPAPVKAVPPDQGGMAQTERLMQNMVASGAMPEHLQMLIAPADFNPDL